MKNKIITMHFSLMVNVNNTVKFHGLKSYVSNTKALFGANTSNDENAFLNRISKDISKVLQ